MKQVLLVVLGFVVISPFGFVGAEDKQAAKPLAEAPPSSEHPSSYSVFSNRDKVALKLIDTVFEFHHLAKADQFFKGSKKTVHEARHTLQEEAPLFSPRVSEHLLARMVQKDFNPFSVGVAIDILVDLGVDKIPQDKLRQSLITVATFSSLYVGQTAALKALEQLKLFNSPYRTELLDVADYHYNHPHQFRNEQVVALAVEMALQQGDLPTLEKNPTLLLTKEGDEETKIPHRVPYPAYRWLEVATHYDKMPFLQVQAIRFVSQNWSADIPYMKRSLMRMALRAKKPEVRVAAFQALSPLLSQSDPEIRQLFEEAIHFKNPVEVQKLAQTEMENHQIPVPRPGGVGEKCRVVFRGFLKGLKPVQM